MSFDFATSVLPGWHTTIFPPYFVAGAIFSGFAMVVTLMVIARWAFQIEHLVTIKHLENMNKIMLATGTIVGYAYATEFFIAWYSGNPYERFAFINRAFGPYCWAYWTMISCNVISPQFFWFKKLRTSMPFMFVISIFVNIGMWFERFVIIATSLHRDFLPSSWGYFMPTWVDILTFLGTFGLFLYAVPLLRALPADDRGQRSEGHDGERADASRSARHGTRSRQSMTPSPAMTPVTGGGALMSCPTRTHEHAPS